MSWNDIKDYGYCAIDANDEAVAFFNYEKHRDDFVSMVNDFVDDEDKLLTKGEYIDTDVTIQVRGS